MNIWNYNNNLETSYAGVQTMKILLDGQSLINHVGKTDVFLLRRAPGNLHYNYVQAINFFDGEQSVFPMEQTIVNNDPIPSIVGFVVQFVIYSTWGDKYYCGLNGIKIFDENNKEVMLTSCSRFTFLFVKFN